MCSRWATFTEQEWKWEAKYQCVSVETLTAFVRRLKQPACRGTKQSRDYCPLLPFSLRLFKLLRRSFVNRPYLPVWEEEELWEPSRPRLSFYQYKFPHCQLTSCVSHRFLPDPTHIFPPVWPSHAHLREVLQTFCVEYVPFWVSLLQDSPFRMGQVCVAGLMDQWGKAH